ncbi:MAG: hypothetical protein GX963_00945 [Bacteroidales bacterium]|nr:hypothetical protein [Bacteroidales bacterium]
MKKVVLIELFDYHSECLYSQVAFLKEANVDLTLIVNHKLEKIVRMLDLDVDIRTYDFKKIRSLLQLRRFILNNNFEVVILNTMQGSNILKFCLLPFPKHIKFVGILHDTSKLETSWGQRMIARRFNHFYTLSKYIEVVDNKKFITTYFNPCYFKKYKTVSLDKGGDLWITVPGSISYKRRSYDVLLEIAKHKDLKENVKFILLGDITKEDGSDFLSKIEKEGIKERFIVFDRFIPDELFHSYLKASDYLLPLIHPETPAAKQYIKNKISGIFPLSQAYGKIILYHQIFEAIKDFDYPALFYNSVEECISLISTPKKIKYYTPPNYEEEKRRYLGLIDLI